MSSDTHNHKKMSKPLALILFIISLPFLIVGLVFFGLIYVVTTVIPAPIEILIYKRSLFFKDLKIKYFLGVTSNFGYKTYKYVKSNPHIHLVFQKNGYYYYKSSQCVYVMPYYAEYKYENGKALLTMKEGGDEISPDSVKPTFQHLIKEDITSLDIKLLVKERFFKKEDLELARRDPVFVFYKNHKDFDRIQ